MKHPPSELTFSARLRDEELTFTTTWGLFSPRGIDEGTRLLIERIGVNEGDDCLDLGCGYGAVGLALSRLSKTGVVWFVDKDFVAVEYARRNARANGIERFEALLSNGLQHIPKETQFDVIASNLPANTGKELLWIVLSEAKDRLRPGGRLYVVTVTGLRDFIKRNFRDIFGNYKKVKQGKTHTVAMAEKLG